MLKRLRSISGAALTTVLMLAFLMTALASKSEAQTPTPVPKGEAVFLSFDHDGLNTDSYTLQVDGGAATAVTPTQVGPANEAGWFVYRTPFPALTPGEHGLRVFACNLGLCAGSEVLSVRVIVRPNGPKGLRIEFVPQG